MHEPLERCQVSIGSKFKLAYLVLATPRHPTLPDYSPPSIWSRAFDDIARIESESETETLPHRVNRKLKSIVITDQLKCWMVCIGEEEIAKSASKPLALAYPENLP
ncbi:hypothetical protein COLO4_04688 [Corchorus olitorius]|uniref:Uncharacterized protein n=1 Tax=Corchorus olitorius TaxID=93759 RepID=A0A1R3KT16_9ROSI|nr:hypothetical protein COLO4_04688 [Corchorus olitorius]